MTRITLTLTDNEKAALIALASAELRPPQDQLRWLLHKAAAEKSGSPVAKPESEVSK